ncbi:hypothetical protein [Salinibacterium sp. SWN1162]|uniref:hypothetical protein n=1 Tax=Salinibacterium sp. SWN1162 TaxID=2792053 RepID=UPI0018CCBA17|nr:hypothetical protein [Salinibacterium sp. SWN1162]MBH0008798.1 hypothetical protein [Salinibacterium sp. SWN1162]
MSRSSRWYSPTKAYCHSTLAQAMTAVALAERVPPHVNVSCIRVPAVRLDAGRLASQPRVLRALYAPKNAAAVPLDSLASTYGRAATRETPLSAVCIDENDAAVPIPRSARDVDARDRLRALTSTATGDIDWAW